MADVLTKIGLEAVDKTKPAWKSVTANASVSAAKIRSMLGGALAAAGGFLGFRALSGTVSELGRLSDMAMKSGASVEELTKSATAFQVMGLDMSVESFARSMQFLEKNTGRNGLAAFQETLATISAIEDPAKRGAELIKNFGRSGMEFAPLVNGGREAVQAFTDLASVIPGVSDAAANAGDAVADAQTLLGKGVSSLWKNVVGYLCQLWGEEFPGGVRAGALNAVNWIETFAKKALAWVKRIGAELGAVGAFWFDVFDKGWGEAIKTYTGTVNAAEKDFNDSMARATASREEYLKKLSSIDIDRAANALGKRGGASASSAAESLGRSTAIRNDLILAGSNAAAKIAAFGPQFSESKKQTQLLEKIAKNTEDTAENTENTADAVEADNTPVTE